MLTTEAKDRAAGRQDHAQPRLLLAHRLKPGRDRAIVRTFLQMLSVTFTEAEIVTPVEAPIDVQFRQAQFHLRELRGHLWGRDSSEHDIRVHPSCALPNAGHRGGQAAGTALAVLVSHLTAALAEHATWYGPRCVGLDALVSVERYSGMLVQPTQPPEVRALIVQGWRSVSVMCPPYGMVLYAADSAPAFLRLVRGRLVRHEDPIDIQCDRAKDGPCSA